LKKTKDVNIHGILFKTIHLFNEENKIEEEKFENSKLPRNAKEEKSKETNAKEQKLIQDFLRIEYHKLIKIFDDIIRKSDYLKQDIFDFQLALWQEPLIKPIFDKKREVQNKIQELETLQKTQPNPNFENQKKKYIEDVKKNKRPIVTITSKQRTFLERNNPHVREHRAPEQKFHQNIQSKRILCRICKLCPPRRRI